MSAPPMVWYMLSLIAQILRDFLRTFCQWLCVPVINFWYTLGVLATDNVMTFIMTGIFFFYYPVAGCQLKVDLSGHLWDQSCSFCWYIELYFLYLFTLYFSQLLYFYFIFHNVNGLVGWVIRSAATWFFNLIVPGSSPAVGKFSGAHQKRPWGPCSL